MDVLWLFAYFFPDKVSSLHVDEALIRDMIDKDYQITIIAATPTRGVDKEVTCKYKNIPVETKHDGKLIIKRARIMREPKNHMLRALRYFVLNIKQYHMACKEKKCSVIIANSTPPTQGVMAAMVKKKTKKKFIYRLCDVFPDSLVVSGKMPSKGFIYSLCHRLEMYSYNAADTIIVVSDDIRRNLVNKGVEPEKITVIHDLVDTDTIKPIKRIDNPLFESLGINRDSFIVTYAGNIGVMQNIEMLVDAAFALRKFDDLKFILFGAGAAEETVKEKIAKLKLTNILLFPLLSQEHVAEVYSLGNVSIAICREGVGSVGMPSKVWSILATGTTLLASFDENTELEKLIDSERCGLFSRAGDVNSLVANITTLYYDRSQCVEMGARGREFVLNTASRKICSNALFEVIDSVERVNN